MERLAFRELRESVTTASGGRVDREACIVRNLRVCGTRSANGRTYTKRALREALKLYEGAPVFFNHPDGESNTRKYEDRFGRLMNVRSAADGSSIHADLKYNPHHPQCERFLWDAENSPRGIGLSHNANGTGRRQPDGSVLVEQITKVHSVDIVDGPATNEGLYEQRRSYRENAMDPLTDPAAPAASGSTSIDEILSGLIQEFAAHPTWDKETKLEKIRHALDLMDEGEPAADLTSDGDLESDHEMYEQRRLARYFASTIDWHDANKRATGDAW
jgi:hypothetical protein